MTLGQYYRVLSVIPVGAFEVYFMGVKLYSKIESKKWPDVPKLIEKCKFVYIEFISGKDISEYEFDKRTELLDVDMASVQITPRQQLKEQQMMEMLRPYLKSSQQKNFKLNGREGLEEFQTNNYKKSTHFYDIIFID